MRLDCRAQIFQRRDDLTVVRLFVATAPRAVLGIRVSQNHNYIILVWGRRGIRASDVLLVFQLALFAPSSLLHAVGYSSQLRAPRSLLCCERSLCEQHERIEGCRIIALCDLLVLLPN